MAISFFAAIPHCHYKNIPMRLTRCTTILASLAGSILLNVTLASTTCRPLPIPTTAQLLNTSETSWFHMLANGQLGGAAAVDFLYLELYSSDIGTIDLGAGDNTNYSTCAQCVVLHQDAVDEQTGKYFLSDRGTREL